MSYYLQNEDGTYLLLESGDKILLEEFATPLTVVTSSPTSITRTTVTLVGNITAGSAATRRGFEYNTSPTSGYSVEETGSFGNGSFSLPVSTLSQNTVYYFRAFAENAEGISYGDWVVFTTDASSYRIEIDGIDRSGDILTNTLIITDILNDQQNTCSFSLVDRSGIGFPAEDELIEIYSIDDELLFAGYIQVVDLGSKMSTGVVRANISCIDYSYLLDRNLVHKTYEDMTDKAIIEDIINTYCAGFGIDTSNVQSTVTISQISFNYVQPTQALRKISDLTGNNWYIDYEKNLYYFPLVTLPAPFNVTESGSEFRDLRIRKDASQIKNRIYVRGGTYLSDPFTYEESGDDAKRIFTLPDKPHDVSVSINGSPKTVGIKNIDSSGFDVYLNFQEKYIELDDSIPTPTPSDTISVTYTYDIPILIAQEDNVSIAAHGVKEFAIFDKSISTVAAARSRAIAELTDYGSSVVEGGLSTFVTGFRSGQYINVTSSNYGVSANYIVTRVVARSLGAGKFNFEIALASAKTMGIIRFLVELLEANKSLIELSNSEVIDELFSLTDSLLSDSLTDALTIDSTGAYFTWCTDSLQSTPITRARWNLFQWG